MASREEIESKGYFYDENLISESQHRRDKIREGVAQDIRLGICAYQHLGFDSPEMYYKIADEVLKMQDRRGVVLKVDKPLPDIRFSLGAIKVYDRNDKPISHTDVANYTQQDMVDAGYVATIPIIKEATNGKGI